MIDTSIRNLQSPDFRARHEAADRLGKLGASAANAIPSLIRVAQHESQQLLLRVIAAEAVTKIDLSQTSAYLEVLIEALRSGDAPILSFALHDLGGIRETRRTRSS